MNIGFTEVGFTKIVKLWKTFIREMNIIQSQKWSDRLVWSKSKYSSSVQISSSQSTSLLLLEMHGVLCDITIKAKWLQFLRVRSIGIILTERGWDIQIIQNCDNSVWVSWLLRYSFISEGKWEILIHI